MGRLIRSDVLYELYINRRLSMKEIGKKIGCTAMTVRKYLILYGIPRRTRLEALKGRKIHRTPEQFNEWRKKISDSKKESLDNKGKNHWNWKGGKIETPFGYFRVHMPTHPYADKGGYVAEHRLVMEKHLGRYLKPEEIIHHINGNGLDNRVKNLKLCSSKSAHQKGHKKRR